MLDSLKMAVELLNGLSPIGIIAILAYIVYLLISKNGPVKAISDNHLSGLPEMNATLLRIEVTMNEVRDGINFLKGRIK
jgi:hypothetical protein